MLADLVSLEGNLRIRREIGSFSVLLGVFRRDGSVGLGGFIEIIAEFDGIPEFVQVFGKALKLLRSSLSLPFFFRFSLGLLGPFAVALGHGEL